MTTQAKYEDYVQPAKRQNVPEIFTSPKSNGNVFLAF